jgi:hypothetical protein
VDAAPSEIGYELELIAEVARDEEPVADPLAPGISHPPP